MTSRRSKADTTAPPPASTEIAIPLRTHEQALLRAAHRVLVECLPGVALPNELPRVRGMLDKHMFGRDKRAHRDGVVEVARQIDRILDNGKLGGAGESSQERPPRRFPGAFS